jgi:hypothetical protein
MNLKHKMMEITKQIEILTELIEAVEELNGEYQEGWEDTIKEAEEMLDYLYSTSNSDNRK